MDSPTYKIKYICPMLGERVIIVFSESAKNEELERLKKLNYKIISESVTD